MSLFDKAADALLEAQLRKQARELHAKIRGMGFAEGRMKQGMAVFVDEFCALSGEALPNVIADVRATAETLAAKRKAKGR